MREVPRNTDQRPKERADILHAGSAGWPSNCLDVIKEVDIENKECLFEVSGIQK